MAQNKDLHRVSRAVIDKISLVAAREVEGVEDVVHYEITRKEAPKSAIETASTLLDKTQSEKYVPGRRDMFDIGRTTDAEMKMRVTLKTGSSESSVTDRLRARIEDEVLDKTGVQLDGIHISVNRD